MSVIDCNYLPTAKVEFQPELALLIVRRAEKMAAAFEEKALDQMTNDARLALQRGVESRVIARRWGSRSESDDMVCLAGLANSHRWWKSCLRLESYTLC